MFPQTVLEKPIYVLVAAGAAILAVIAFAIYIFLLKRRVAVYSQEFDAAIDEFNAGCNPGHPMTDEEWGQYRSSHDDDFEYAHKVASSKLIALFVRDISNANTLVDIDDNHQAYLDDARVKNGYITTFEQAIEEAIEAKRATFDGLHYIAHSESLELEQKVKEATDAANPTNQAEPALPQPQQPRPRVGYVNTNTIQSRPKHQWPTEYPEGMPSWFKNRNNQSNQ